jgi:hypothetical protein
LHLQAGGVEELHHRPLEVLPCREGGHSSGLHVCIPDRPPGARGSIQKGGDIANPRLRSSRPVARKCISTWNNHSPVVFCLVGWAKARRWWGSDSGAGWG